MNVEDKYLDVLQNIEFVIVSEYRAERSMTDSDVLHAVQELVRQYAAEERNQRHAPLVCLPPRAQKIFDSVKSICEVRLGRDNSGNFEMKVISTDELLQCLKRIRSSIKFWTKEAGARGYLSHVNSFMP